MENKKLKKIDDEIWKPIDITDGVYHVSSYGRIKSYFYHKKEGKFIKPGVIRGFFVVNLKIGKKTKTFYVHKLVAEAFIKKNTAKDTVVMHLDWNKKNNFHENLAWTTREESYKRIHAKLLEDRKLRGKIVTKSKLSPDDVRVLKSMLAKGVKQNVVAKLFCISEMQVSRIKRGDNWADINPAEK